MLNTVNVWGVPWVSAGNWTPSAEKKKLVFYLCLLGRKRGKKISQVVILWKYAVYVSNSYILQWFWQQVSKWSGRGIISFKHGRQCLNECKRWSMLPSTASHRSAFLKPLHFLQIPVDKTASKYLWNLKVLHLVFCSTPLPLQRWSPESIYCRNQWLLCATNNKYSYLFVHLLFVLLVGFNVTQI